MKRYYRMDSEYGACEARGWNPEINPNTTCNDLRFLNEYEDDVKRWFEESMTEMEENFSGEYYYC